MKIQNWVLVIIFQLLVHSCTSKEKIVTLQLSEKNPTEYTFTISKDSLFNIIRTNLSIKGMYVWNPVDRPAIFKTFNNTLLQNGAELKFVLEISGLDFYAKGFLKSNGDSLSLQGMYYVYFEKISKEETRVLIRAVDIQLIVGKDLLPSPPHMVRNYKYVKVDSSTIEEYEILLAIGGLINEHKMPKIIQPNAQSKNEHK